MTKTVIVRSFSKKLVISYLVKAICACLILFWIINYFIPKHENYLETNADLLPRVDKSKTNSFLLQNLQHAVIGDKKREKENLAQLKKTEGTEKVLSAKLEMEGAGKLPEDDDVEMDEKRDALNYNIHLFYYPWYGTPEVDGEYLHWNHQVGQRKKLKKKMENLHTCINPTGNSYCCCKSSARGLVLDSHPKNYHQKMTY